MRVISVNRSGLKLIVEVSAKEWGVLMFGLVFLGRNSDPAIVANSKEILEECDRQFNECMKTG